MTGPGTLNRSQNCPNVRNNKSFSKSDTRSDDRMLNSGKRRKRVQNDHPTPPSPAKRKATIISTPYEVTEYTKRPPIENIAQVGQGTYGKVYKAVDISTKRLLAMKRLRVDVRRDGLLPVTAAREIKLLQNLRHHNIIQLNEIVVFQEEVYMAFDYIEHDLAGLLHNSNLEFSPGNIKSIIRQTLSALLFLHQKSVLHRDVKGSNILITANGTVKLADFGLARVELPVNSHTRYTNRVVTLWYRPPELLLGAEFYSGEVDIWGVGCLLVELFIRKALFCGKNDVSQLFAIYSIMGAPTTRSWPAHVRLPWVPLLNALPPQNDWEYKFDQVFKGDNITSSCFDLASRMLILDPCQRLMAKDALNHPFFTEDPKEQALNLKVEHEWHDWEAKQRSRQNNTSSNTIGTTNSALPLDEL